MTELGALYGLIVAGAAFAAAVGLTPVARAVAHRTGLVSVPSADRWHVGATALLGGVALFGATLGVAGLALVALPDTGMGRILSGLTPPVVGTLVAATFMFAVGLADDLMHLRPQVKFVAQAVAGIGLVSSGAILNVTPWYAPNVIATLFWFIALTNAFNLLDNMDGIAAGVAGVAAAFLGVAFYQQGAWVHALVAWAVAGSAFGFLLFNFRPASIFMGDAGSLFLGALMAGLVASSPTPVAAGFVWAFLVPVSIVAVPVLDTALVTITRTLAGRAVSQGGRDHSTHRLVALGLEERQVALVLYGLTALGGTVALLMRRLDTGLGGMIGAGFFVAVCLLAAYLTRVQVHDRAYEGRDKPVSKVLTKLLYKRRLAEMLLDVVLLAIAYYGAYRLRFDGVPPGEYAQIFRSTVAIVIGVKIFLFGLFGVYRGSWRYVGIGDLHRLLGAISAGYVVFALYASVRVPALAFPGSILIIDALLTAGLVLGSRLSFRSFEALGRLLHAGRGVAIYGAGDAGELAARELLNNKSLKMKPVCFLDDDSRKHGSLVHGIPVVGGLDRVSAVVRRFGAELILISTRKLSPRTIARVRDLATQQGLQVAELSVDVRTLSSEADVSADPPVPAPELEVSRYS